MYLEIDKDKLMENLDFPLRYENGTIYDNSNKSLAVIFDEDLARHVTGKFIEIEDVEDRYKIDGNFNIVDRRNYDEKVATVMGLDYVKHFHDPIFRKNNIAKYIVNRLNVL